MVLHHAEHGRHGAGQGIRRMDGQGENGASLQDYVNTYYTLRYRPVRGSDTWNLLAKEHPGWTDDDFWSPWADEQLAEGWLQRVLNSLTPFAQRVEDFYNNPSDIAFTMLEQIGKPYQGDVALNNDNLTEVGLLELYQTVFNRAESLLVAAGGNNIDMSKQLMLAQTRMGEFYSLLGAEAYSDAKNPLISAGADGQQFASGTFSFANQVPSLLDEELALLRGRTSATAYPRMTEAPLYNRLAWNLTKGITEGEPAYVANYGIRARDGVLDVNCAAAQYPQGHGDAWGHYLSALTGYYRLIRNPYFDWATAMGEMLMDQKLMNVDYQDEQKFADAAVKLVQTGTDAMDLTMRKAYKENGGDVKAAYFDADEEQAFGYGEWATRTGMAAAYNWMTVNALLPTNDAPYKAFTDKGVKKINRVTASELYSLASSVRVIERKLQGVESGANPLGLSENAIPFDIDPDRLAQKDSHFEQILERAEKSLANCKTVLDYANVYGSRLAQIAKDEEAALADLNKQEEAFNNQLIAIYGTPFSGDIGAGKTYPQGYDGPDIYNYTYMDLTPYGILDGLQTAFTNSYKLVERDTAADAPGLGWKYKNKLDWLGNVDTNAFEEIPISYIVNEGGIRMKPLTVTGARRSEGSIQAAYRNYLSAYLKVKEVMSNYDTKLTMLKEGMKLIKTMEGAIWQTFAVELGVNVAKIPFYSMDQEYQIELGRLALEIMRIEKTYVSESIPGIQGTGTTIIIDPSATAGAASYTSGMANLWNISSVLLAAYSRKHLNQNVNSYIDLAKVAYDIEEKIRSTYDELRGKIDTAAMEVNLAALAIQPAFADLAAAEAAYRTELAPAGLEQRDRAALPRHVQPRAAQHRAHEVHHRVRHRPALRVGAREGVRLRDGAPLQRPAGRQAVPRGHHRDPLARTGGRLDQQRDHGRRALRRREPHEGELGRPEAAPRHQQPGQAGEVVLAPPRALPHQGGRGRRRGLEEGAGEVPRGEHPHGFAVHPPLPAAGERDRRRLPRARIHHPVLDGNQQRRKLLRQGPAVRRPPVLELRLCDEDRRGGRGSRRPRPAPWRRGRGAEHLPRAGRPRLHAFAGGHRAQAPQLDRRRSGDAAPVHRRFGRAGRDGLDLDLLGP